MEGTHPETTHSSTGKAQLRPWQRLHTSTYVVLLLAAAVLFLLNVPGQRTLEFALSPGGGAREQLKLEQSGVDTSRLLGGHIAVSNSIVHGWPNTWLVRDDVGGYEDPVPRGTSIWSFSEDLRSFNPWRLVANIAVAVVLTAAFGLLFERWRRRRQRLWQQTTRDLLILVAVVGAATAFALKTAREYREERAALAAMRYLTPDGWDLFMLNSRTSGGPSWLQEILGRWWRPWFERTVHLEIPPEHLPHLSSFRQLKALAVYDLRLPEERLSVVGTLKQLELLHLMRGGFLPLRDAADATDDKSVAHLLGNLVGLNRLKSLRVDAGTFGDESARAVAELPRLRILVVVDAAEFTDDGLAALAQCKQLEVLHLGVGHRITSNGLRQLVTLPHLELLSLPASADLKAVEALQHRVPQLKIEVGGKPFVANQPTDEG